MTVAFGAAGLGGNNTTLADPSYPAGISADTSVIFALVCGRSSVAGGAFTGPVGWTSLGQFEDGVGAYGPDDGPRRIAIFRKDVTEGTELSTDREFFDVADPDATSIVSAIIFRVEKPAGFVLDHQIALGADLSLDTALSISRSFQLTAGKLLLVGVALNNDLATLSSPALTASGITFGTVQTHVQNGTTVGNDVLRTMVGAPIVSGVGIVSTTLTATLAAAATGPAAFLLLTERDPNVTAPLSGQSISSSHGAIYARQQGVTAISMAGSVGQAHSIPLVGQQILVSPGPISVLRRGQGAFFAQGSAGVSVTAPLSGSAATFSPGTLTPTSMLPALIGQELAHALGSVTPAADNPKTVHLSGVEAAVSAGDVSTGGQTLTGSEATSADGDMGCSLELALFGIQANFAHGMVSVGQDADDVFIQGRAGQPVSALDIPLTGLAIASAQGNVGLSNDAFIPLSGEEAAVAAGDVSFAEAFPLSGVEATSAQGNVGAPGGAALTGAEAQVIAGTVHTTNDRSFPLVGLAASVLTGAAFASPLAFATGASITVSSGRLSEPRSHTLSAGGSIAFSGDATVHPARDIDLTSGGLITFSGQKALSWEKQVVGSGTIEFGGTAPVLFLPLGLEEKRLRMRMGVGL